MRKWILKRGPPSQETTELIRSEGHLSVVGGGFGKGVLMNKRKSACLVIIHIRTR